MTKRARDPSPAPRKVRKSSGGASDETTDSTKKRGREVDTASSKKPAKSPKIPSPTKNENESVTEQRKKAQEWAATVLPSAKKMGASKKSEAKVDAKTPSSGKKADVKTSTGKKPVAKKEKESSTESGSSGSTAVVKSSPAKKVKAKRYVIDRSFAALVGGIFISGRGG